MFPIPHPSTVPLGIYAKEALKSMELWSLLESKLVYTASSQSNLKFISNGDALVGISYLSDAVSSPNILIVAKIDEKILPQKAKQYYNRIVTNHPDSPYAKILTNPEEFGQSDLQTPEKVYESLVKIYQKGDFDQLEEKELDYSFKKTSEK